MHINCLEMLLIITTMARLQKVMRTLDDDTIIITITSKTINITITITFHYYTFIITVEPKKHNTSRFQSNFQGLLLLHCITYHRHFATDNIITKLS